MTDMKWMNLGEEMFFFCVCVYRLSAGHVVNLFSFVRFEKTFKKYFFSYYKHRSALMPVMDCIFEMHVFFI